MVDNTDNGDTPVDTQEQTLEDFEKVYYGEEEAQPDPEPEEDENEEEDHVEEDSTEEDDSLATEEDDEEEEVEEPQPKKHSAQKRINDLTAKLRQSEREANARIEALMREVETLKEGRSEKDKPEELREQLSKLPEGAPDPDALDEEGNPIYELGEFDKKYIRDLTKFTIAEETRRAEEERAQKEWNEGVAAAQQELTAQWAEKVAQVEETIPTIREEITTLTETFESLDPGYGEYLAMTIMQCDNGPEIMSYFAQNIGEAQKIVASGPAAATLAIGRLEAQLSKSSTKPGEKRNRVSNAPTPPGKGARGVSGRQNIRPDTDNLDAFEKLYYNK